jgi:hypothetical protein
MNTSNLANEMYLPSIVAVAFRSDFMDLTLSDGRILSVPLAWYPKLAAAEAKALQNFELSPGGHGIHWPGLDEDLSVKGFLLPQVQVA